MSGGVKIFGSFVIGIILASLVAWFHSNRKVTLKALHEDLELISINSTFVHSSFTASKQSFQEYDLLVESYLEGIAPFNELDFEATLAENQNLWNSRGSSLLVQILNGQIYVDRRNFTSYLPWDKLRFHHILNRLQLITAVSPVDNVEFILNTHDCPIRNQKTVVPIFSIIRCRGMRMLPVPQWFRWRDGSFENWDTKQAEYLEIGRQTPWHLKEGKAIFRGNVRASVLQYNNVKERLQFVNITSNSMIEWGRTKLYHLSTLHPELLDVGLFGKGLDGSRSILERLPNYEFKSPITMEEQSRRFKYVVYAEGSCGWADRLKILLVSGMLVFLQETPCQEHFTPLLRPWEHYVPVANGFTDLIEKIKWARDNDDKVQEIIENAALWALKYNSQVGWDYYLLRLLQNYRLLMSYEPKLRRGMEQFIRSTNCPNRRDLKCDERDSFGPILD